MRLFNSGSVAMDVNLEKTGFFQGESVPPCFLTFFDPRGKAFNPCGPRSYRRRPQGPGSHRQQLVSRDQAQVHGVQKAQLLCQRHSQRQHQRPHKRGGRAHSCVHQSKRYEGHQHSTRCRALHPQLLHPQSRVPTQGKLADQDCSRTIKSLFLLTCRCLFSNFIFRSTWTSNTHLTRRLNFPSSFYLHLRLLRLPLRLQRPTLTALIHQLGAFPQHNHLRQANLRALRPHMIGFTPLRQACDKAYRSHC